MYLDLLTTSSYVSPAYVQGTKSSNVARLEWKYAAEGDGSFRDVAICADTWWVASIDLDKSGKSQDLSLADRQVHVDFRLTNAAGKWETLENLTITWKIMTVGAEREDVGVRRRGSWSRPGDPGH